MEQQANELLEHVVDYLVAERKEHGNGMEVPILLASQAETRWQFFRALVNTRVPLEADPSFYEAQDELLSALIDEAGVAALSDAKPSPTDGRMLLWHGDITTLAVDAIVNAANSRMLGCWAPNHLCIDNAIHTFAGVQLREECARLMQGKGIAQEPTGLAEVTDAYNLPARFVIHTVGPIATAGVQPGQAQQLASCYTSCLDAAEERGCSSIAFCCISTGEFGYPQDEAAGIAVETVRGWLDAHPDSSMSVVFDVFGDEDERLYRKLLGL